LPCYNIFIMKYRDYKENGENIYFHIYNRGNRKENIYLDKEDYDFFLLRFLQNINPNISRPRKMEVYPEGTFSLLAYALLPNHFHFLICQNKDIPINKIMLKICTSYAIYFNKKYNKIGHVFQDRFKQKIVKSDEQLKWLSAYIHQNPVIHGISNSMKDYKWTSFGEYFDPVNSYNLCETSILLGQFSNSFDFFNFTDKNFEILKQNKNIKKFCYD